MQVGLSLPQAGNDVTAGRVLGYARAAEDAGFDSLWAFDHVVMPRAFTSRYPYSQDGQPPRYIKAEETMLEPLTMLSVVAGATSRIQLGTKVLVLPMRQPVLHAKMLATLDYLAGGRFILGAGVGWCAEEFEVLGMPFDRRGARMDEALQLLRALWTEDWVDFEGEFYQVKGWTSRPKPVRPIPIWIGGDSPRALDRAGRYCDGWLATPAFLPRLKESWERIRTAASEAGRDPDALTLAYMAPIVISAERMEQAAGQCHDLRDIGVQHIVLVVNPKEPSQTHALIDEFASRYLPALQA